MGCFQDKFNEVAKSGEVLYSSGNWNIMLYKEKCYAIATNKGCLDSFFGDMNHVYDLILQDIQLKRNIFQALRRFIALKKHFNDYDFKKTRLRYFLKSIK